MNAKQRAFVNAYLGDAHGNGSKAAIAAGYSQKTAPQIASQLLKHPEVKAALARRLDKADLSAERALQNVANIANHRLPEQVSAATILKANEVILQAEGRLKPEKPPNQGVTVIGFLGVVIGSKDAVEAYHASQGQPALDADVTDADTSRPAPAVTES